MLQSDQNHISHFLLFTDMSQCGRELKKHHYGSHVSDTMS